MQFKFTSALSLLAAITPALAGLNPLQELTEATVNVRDIFDNVGPTSIEQDGNKGITQYKERILDLKQDTIKSFPGGFQKPQPIICEDFANFAAKSEDLMNALITKHSLLAQTYLVRPLETILDTDQQRTKYLTNDVLEIVPSCEDKIEGAVQKMRNAYDKAVDVYSN